MQLKHWIARACVLLSYRGCGSIPPSPAVGAARQPMVSFAVSRTEALTHQASKLAEQPNTAGTIAQLLGGYTLIGPIGGVICILAVAAAWPVVRRLDQQERTA